MIELRNISKIYGQDTIAVRNLNLTIQDHEFFVIYGPAGAGKTTTLRLIGGISQPSQGDILRDGVSICKCSPGEPQYGDGVRELCTLFAYVCI